MAKANYIASVELQFLINAALSSSPLAVTDVERVDLQKLYTLAQWHGIRNQLYASASSEIIPDQLYQRLHAFATQSTFQALFQTNTLSVLLDVYERSNIPYYTYKGVVWSQWLYGDLNSRTSGDIDLLIPKSYLSKAIQVTQELGYQSSGLWNYLLNHTDEDIKEAFLRSDYHIPLHHANNPSLEIHWQLAYTRLAFHFPETEWEQWKKLIPFQNREIIGFQNEYQLLLLIMHHGGKERWDQLKYIADLVAYLHRYSMTTDWALVIRLAKEKGMEKLMYHALSLVNSLIPTHQFLLPDLKNAPSEIERYLRKWDQMESLPENSTWPYLKHGLQMRDGVKHRLKVAKEHLKYFSEIRLLRAKAKWYQNDSKT